MNQSSSRLGKVDRNLAIAQYSLSLVVVPFIWAARRKVQAERQDQGEQLSPLEEVRFYRDGLDRALERLHDQVPSRDPALDNQGPEPVRSTDTQGPEQPAEPDPAVDTQGSDPGEPG